MKTIVLYARSATSEEEVDRQFQMMRESMDPEVDVVARYSDVGSGRDPQRPGLQQALQLVLDGGAEVLMATSLDRII